ncbi:hypothetical protein D3C71_1336600 [compost metagenome]
MPEGVDVCTGSRINEQLLRISGGGPLLDVARSRVRVDQDVVAVQANARGIVQELTTKEQRRVFNLRQHVRDWQLDLVRTEPCFAQVFRPQTTVEYVTNDCPNTDLATRGCAHDVVQANTSHVTTRLRHSLNGLGLQVVRVIADALDLRRKTTRILLGIGECVDG